jgi:recombinational DNA repair protein (RecF pathway)
LERGEANPKAPVLPPDPVVRTLAAWALELVMAFEARDNPAPEPFNLLLRHLADLAGGGRQAPPALAGRAASAAFTKLYLELAGFGTDFTRCRLCGRTGLPLLRLSAEAKGPLCPDCAKASGRRNPAAPAEFIGSLALVHKRGDLPILSEQGLSAAETYFRRLAALESGRAFKSPRVLRQLLEEAPGPPAMPLETGGPLDKAPEAPAGPSARTLETGGPLDEAPEAPAGPSARTLETGGPLGGLA